MSSKKRYVLVGTGGRSEMYLNAMTGDYSRFADLRGICDLNPGRLEYRASLIERATGERPKTYTADRFDDMLEECRPDTVIVTTGPDRTHADYICRALEAGCDAVTEKPMTTDAEMARRILETVDRTGRNLQVTFNYRYSPPRTQVRRLIQEGAIGDVLSVDFAWILNTRHGADYFRRWHRKLGNSGSLLVHKATHHFDLVNWWIDDVPEEVFCHGSKRFYTGAEADRRGLRNRGERCLGCPERGHCPFYLDIENTGSLKALYLDNESYDGYYRDRCVFSDEIDIWDTMSMSVRYRGGALLNYTLHAYSPIEGYGIAFNGSTGRLEQVARETEYVSGDGSTPGEMKTGEVTITHIPQFQSPRIIDPDIREGGHGGGDPELLSHIFDPDAPADPLRRKANQVDGTYSIMVGIAGYHSIREGRPVRISDLIGGAPLGKRW